MARHLFVLLLAVLSMVLPCQGGEEPGKKLRVVVFGGPSGDPEAAQVG